MNVEFSIPVLYDGIPIGTLLYDDVLDRWKVLDLKGRKVAEMGALDIKKAHRTAMDWATKELEYYGK